MPTRILLADDNEPYRNTLRALLNGSPGLQVVAEVSEGEAVLRQAREMPVDVVLMDVVMSGVNGIEATRRLMTAFPDVRVLALSMHTDPAIVEGMLEAGACGYATKDSEAEELIGAVRLVAGGGTYLSPELEGPPDPTVDGES